jgi:hypothetical protein
MIILFFPRIRQSARTIPTSLVFRFQKKVGENAPLSEYYKLILTDPEGLIELGGLDPPTNPTHHLAQFLKLC